MRNLTPTIKQLIATDTLWSVNDFYLFVEDVKKEGFDISYWENEEYWAGVANDKEAVGYIWQKYPLIIIASKYAKDFSSVLKNFDFVVLMEVGDLTSEEFCLDEDKEITDRISEGLNYSRFSANDLWFHTVN